MKVIETILFRGDLSCVYMCVYNTQSRRFTNRAGGAHKVPRCKIHFKFEL